MSKSIEEKVEDVFKRQLDSLGVRRYGKAEAINPDIKAALSQAESKSGGQGGNFPDIQCLLDDGYGRRIPVMMEVKGSKGKLEKLEKNGSLADSIAAVQGYAVNGAWHYGQALLTHIDDCSEVLIIGLNGSQIDSKNKVVDLTCKAYYLSAKNGGEPKHVPELDDDLTLLSGRNTGKLFQILDDALLTDEERENAVRRIEEGLEASVKAIHQRLYDDEELQVLLGTNDKLYLFVGLIMAGLSTRGINRLTQADFKGDDDDEKNDGYVVLSQIKAFLKKRNVADDKRRMIQNLLKPVFTKPALWQPRNGASILKSLFKQIRYEVIPHLESPFHIDFTGKIMNSLNDWVSIENDKKNDVVLTPRYVTSFMARLCRTNMNSRVWDRAMGSAGFLVSALDIMIRDAKNKIQDVDALAKKIENIKKNQLLGIEILGNIYILAVLNMILMGDGSSNMYYGDSHTWDGEFEADVFLLNPPYSAPGKGLNFVLEALSCMEGGYAAVLIQENAGAGQGEGYPMKLLKKHTLLASIHMPDKLFVGKSSVQTAIYVFEINKPHDPDGLVKFIDFSDDGYARMNRRKSTQEVNLQDVDHAADRYAEVEALVLGKKPRTGFYTKENGLFIEDTITLEGTDWTVAQHKTLNNIPAEDEFRQTIADYLAWKLKSLLHGKPTD